MDISPLDEAGDTYLLSAHMLQHVLIADVAPATLIPIGARIERAPRIPAQRLAWAGTHL